MPEIEMTDVEKALGGLKAPVSRVSPDMVYDFCLKLHKKFRRRFPSGYALRLPTEAEWEFAYRANSTPEDLYGKPVFTSKEEGFKIGFRGVAKLGIIRKELPTADIAKMDEYLVPGCTVGMKEPNPWGIYDMCGNICEWTLDGYSKYTSAAQKNPKVERINDVVQRSMSSHASWKEADHRITFRYKKDPNHARTRVGIRLCLVCSE
jgi:formylglycine-generating enzyme required for sulfatase activity